MQLQPKNTHPQMVMMATTEDLKEAITQVVNEAMEKREPAPEVYITHAEAVKRIGVCRTTLWNWNRLGYLPKYYRGKRVIYRLSDVERVIRGEV